MDFKFVSWEAHINAQVIADGKFSDTEYGAIGEAIRIFDASDYKQIAEYYLQHANEVLPTMQDDETWGALKYFAEKVLDSENINDIAMACLNMGKAVKAFEVPTYDEQIEYSHLLISKNKREFPLKVKNLKESGFKEVVQSQARFFWERDTAKELRLADMAEKVWDFVLDQGDSHKLPFDKPMGLKSWLRPVGEEFGYPCAQGRPRKK